MDIPAQSPTVPDRSAVVVSAPSSLAWLNLSKLPSKLLTRLLSLVLGLAIVSLADAALATLRQGDSGAAVQDLQNRLIAAQCYDGPVTSYFGPLTRSAVEQCQQRFGVTVDGVVGPQTLGVLNGGSANGGVATQPQSTAMAADNALQRGSRGAAVAELQQQLQKLGLYNSTIDGDFGPITEQAVASFQRLNNLNQTGVFGDREQQMMAETPVGQPSAVATDLTGTIGRSQLTLGDAGKDVQKLQAKLKELRYFDSALTGYYGSMTKVAVQSFQADRKMPNNGIADAQTLQALGITIGNQAAASGTGTSTPTASSGFSTGGFTSAGGGTPISKTNPIPTQAFGTAQVTQGGRFVVIIPKRNSDQLAAVKQLVPDATEGKSSIGNYIQAGAYASQDAADQQSRFLQAYGLDARVAYR